MSIVDNTYFTGDIYLPQVGNKWQTEDVNKALETYEPVILKKLLGYELWNIVDLAWKAFNETIPTPLPDRIDKLINGDNFSIPYCGNTLNTHWNGFRNTEKMSILSYYTYFKYRNNTEGRTTTTGEAKTKKENANVISARSKLVYAYNEMVMLYGLTPKGCCNNMSSYQINAYYLDHRRYRYYNTLPSCYNYLFTNIDTYPEWIFQPVYKLNVLGI